MTDIDPVQFGQMVEAVKNLTKTVETLTMSVKTLERQVQSLTDIKNRGAGVLLGILLAGGSIGAGVTHLLDKMK